MNLSGRIRRLEERRGPERTSRPESEARTKLAALLQQRVANHLRAGGEPCPYRREDYASPREYVKDVMCWYTGRGD